MASRQLALFILLVSLTDLTGAHVLAAQAPGLAAPRSAVFAVPAGDPAAPAAGTAVPDTGAAAPGSGAAEASADLSFFFKPLSAYGHWVLRADHGWFWVPSRMPAGWRPYTAGHWALSDQGWSWESDEPFGWATYHYGRWLDDAEYGWVWLPGDDWAPAWVTWRSGGGYVGWAPLPPDDDADNGSAMDPSGEAVPDLDAGGRDVPAAAVPPGDFCFVAEGSFLAPELVVVVVPVELNVTVLRQTAPVVNRTAIGTVMVNLGVPAREIERVVGHHIEVIKTAGPPAGGPRSGPPRGDRPHVFQPHPLRTPLPRLSPGPEPRRGLTPAPPAVGLGWVTVAQRPAASPGAAGATSPGGATSYRPLARPAALERLPAGTSPAPAGARGGNGAPARPAAPVLTAAAPAPGQHDRPPAGSSVQQPSALQPAAARAQAEGGREQQRQTEWPAPDEHGREQARNAELRAQEERTRQDAARAQEEQERQQQAAAREREQAQREQEEQRQAELRAQQQREQQRQAEQAAEQRRQAEVQAQQQHEAELQAQQQREQQHQAEIEAQRQREQQQQRQAEMQAQQQREQQRQAEMQAQQQREQQQRQAEMQAQQQREQQRQAEIQAQQQRAQQQQQQAEQKAPPHR